MNQSAPTWRDSDECALLSPQTWKEGTQLALLRVSSEINIEKVISIELHEISLKNQMTHRPGNAGYNQTWHSKMQSRMCC